MLPDAMETSVATPPPQINPQLLKGGLERAAPILGQVRKGNAVNAIAAQKLAATSQTHIRWSRSANDGGRIQSGLRPGPVSRIGGC